MFNVWKQYFLINYYTLASIILCSGGLAFWLDYVSQKSLSIIIGFCLGLAFFAISSRMIIIFITAAVSMITLAIFYQMINFSLLPTIFGIVTAMLIGYSLTFSKGRWFIVLYIFSLALVAGIATLFGLFLPSH